MVNNFLSNGYLLDLTQRRRIDQLSFSDTIAAIAFFLALIIAPFFSPIVLYLYIATLLLSPLLVLWLRLRGVIFFDKH